MKSISSLILGACLFAVPANAALVGWWGLDEGAGTVAGDSVSGLDGTITGATWFSDPERGSVLSFDGATSVVDVGAGITPQFTSTSTFSLAFWSFNEGNNATKPNAVVIGNRYQTGTTDWDPREFVKVTPTKFEVHVLGNGNDNLDVPDMALNEWHHHAVVKDGTELNYYIDGVLEGSSTLTQPDAMNNAQPLYFGGSPGAGAGEFFQGRLDDIRIYDSALTATEVGNIIPEPSSTLLMLSGMSAFLLRRRR